MSEAELIAENKRDIVQKSLIPNKLGGLKIVKEPYLKQKYEKIKDSIQGQQ